jgi:hypothetical protein
LRDGDHEIAYFNLVPYRAEATTYQNIPFHGVSFCLDKKHWSRAKLGLHFQKGYIQKTIEIIGLEKWVEDKNS